LKSHFFLLTTQNLLKPEQAGAMSRCRLFSKENTFWAASLHETRNSPRRVFPAHRSLAHAPRELLIRTRLKPVCSLKDRGSGLEMPLFSSHHPELLKPEQAGAMSRCRLFSKENTFWVASLHETGKILAPSFSGPPPIGPCSRELLIRTRLKRAIANSQTIPVVSFIFISKEYQRQQA
jgi:hypothetical protein